MWPWSHYLVPTCTSRSWRLKRPTVMAAPHSTPLLGDPPEIAHRKALARQHCVQSLRTRASGVDAGIMAHLKTLLTPCAQRAIACVWPLPNEVDLRPLCHWLHDNGAQVLLPETTPRGTPLIFRHWHPACTMQAGRFGTHAPDGPALTPDIVLVPLLGFDRTGNRLGYGGGYYDRTLAGLPAAQAIGYAPSTQEVAALPSGPHDQKLPCIVTEREILRFDPPSA